MVRFLSACILGLGCLFAPACGGSGGGGGGGTPPPAGLPGSLIALALQNGAAPGPTAGTYGLISTTPVMDTAHGGWTSYMVPVMTPGGTLDVLYVAQPDNTIVEVWAQGDTIPGAPARTIADIQRTWITPTGRVFCAVVPLGGGGVTFLSAQVTAGVVSARAEIIEAGDTVVGGGGALWSTFQLDSVCVTDTGTLWFLGVDNGLIERLGSVAFDGGTLQIHVSAGSALPGAITVVNIVTYGIDSLGGRFAFVADTTAGQERLYSGVPGSSLFLERLRPGETLPLPFGGTVDDVWQQGPILVYSNNTVILQAEGSQAATDDVLVSLVVDGGGAALPAVILLRSGATPPASGGGQIADILLLEQSRSTTYPMFRCTIFGVPGVTVAIYALSASIQVVVFESQAAPDGGAFTSAFPSLSLQQYTDATRQGSLAFRNVVNTGDTGLFWSFRDIGLFRVALEGGIAPGGDTWASLGVGAHSVADDTLAFYAQVVTSGAGLFRQH